MELRLRRSDKVYIIDVEGDMDLYNAHKIKELFGKMVEKNISRFVVNLEKVEYIDSSGVGALLSIFASIKKHDLFLSIANVHGSVKKVIELTKLMDYLPIAETLQEAINHIK